MILLVAVLLGLLAGFLRAIIGKRSFQPVGLKLEWLVVFALVPQVLVFNVPFISAYVPDTWARIILIASQVVLLLFCWVNRQHPGFWLMGIGLGLNLMVITLNGGLMPIRPELLEKFLPDAPAGTWQIGRRLGITKDIVLPLDQTRLWWFSDYLTLPNWIPYRVAFSIGDIILSLGVIQFLWSLGGKTPKPQEPIISEANYE